jgi:peptidoglycan hydrolase-like protein with peptidoglycan-binding domain
MQDHLLALPKGYRLRQYEIVRMLGAGGFGITYLAHDTTLDKQVAIKEYLPSDFALRDGNSHVTAKSTSSNDDFHWGLTRFLDEARILAKFPHHNIVEIFQIFEANQTAYIVMDFIEGDTLSAAIERDAPMDEAVVRGLLASILDGLKRVHLLGFLHRDIKPGNIILRENGDPVLIDFGAARQALEAKSRSLTSVVTEGYAPIEQYASSGNQGPWTDIYALGAVAYKCLTGVTPVAATVRLRQDPLEPLAHVAANRGSPAFLQAIDWALAPDERDRPQTVEDWQAHFDSISPTPEATRRVTPAYTPERTVRAPHVTTAQRVEAAGPSAWSRLPPAARYGGAAAILGIAAFLGWFFVINQPAPEDAKDWANAEQANTIQGYKVYETMQPAGFYFARADRKISALTTEQDTTGWQSASTANTIEAYAQYISVNPAGAHIGEAKVRSTKLEEQAHIRDSQVVLSRMGLYNGAANGVMDAQTSDATRQYQRQKGIAQTGTITPELMRYMGDDLAAIERQKRLETERAARAARLAAEQERSAYSSAIASHQRSEYESFLGRYAGSQYAADIRSRLSSCHQETRVADTVERTPISAEGTSTGTTSNTACRIAESNASTRLRGMCSGGRLSEMQVHSAPSGGDVPPSEASANIGNVFGALARAAGGRHMGSYNNYARRSSYTCEAAAEAQCERATKQQRSVEICR